MKNTSRKMTALVATFALTVISASIAPVSAQDAMSMDELLRAVERGRIQDNQEAREREERFRTQRANQQTLLSQAQVDKNNAEARSKALEGSFEANKAELKIVEAELREALGSLKELFGVMQQVSGDAQARFETSITSAQYPNRGEFLEELAKKIGSGSKLPSLEEINKLWFELTREMVASGEIIKFSTNVEFLDGTSEVTDVVRVGLFNLSTDGKYLKIEDGVVQELGRQPPGRFTNSTEDLFEATDEKVRFGIDPTLGGVLKTYKARPDILARINQGGLVGYLIIALGLIGLLISLERLISLGNASRKVTAQLTSGSANSDNALGRVLAVAENHKSADTDTLELKLSEAIFKETPALNRSLLFIKIISVVAPLMGLLGTVVGMIQTFQAITLFGTGDPKLMAGGISQALMTTVLGLTVAIPMVLLHTLVSGRSKRIVQVLQEQSAGIIAEHAERGHG